MRRLLALVSFSCLFLAIPNVGLSQDDRNDRALNFLRGLDRNGDGEITPDETPGRTRDALQRMAEQAGMNADGPVSLSRLERALQRSSGRGSDDGGDRGRGFRGRGGDGGDGDRFRGGPPGGEGGRFPGRGGDWGGRFRGGPPGQDGESFRGRGGRDRGRDREEAPQETESSSDARFGNASPQGFGASENSRAQGFNTPAQSRSGGSGSSGSSSQEGDDRTKQFAEGIMRRFDANGNRVLDKDEWSQMRGNYEEADANKDTVITSTELSLYMANRMRGNSRSSDGRSGRGGGGDDPRSRWGGGDPRSRFGGGDDPRSRWGGGDPRSRFGGGGDDPRSRWGGGDPRSRFGGGGDDPRSRWGGGDPRSRFGGGGDPRSRFGGGDPRSRFGNSEDLRSRWGGRRGSQEEEEETRKSYRFLTPAERISELLSERIRNNFLEMDTNGDGQIAMSEYSSSWDDEMLDEFKYLDSNSDGMVTPEEYKEANEQ